jgi:hypothetical protein
MANHFVLYYYGYVKTNVENGSSFSFSLWH